MGDDDEGYYDSGYADGHADGRREAEIGLKAEIAARAEQLERAVEALQYVAAERTLSTAVTVRMMQERAREALKALGRDA